LKGKGEKEKRKRNANLPLTKGGNKAAETGQSLMRGKKDTAPSHLGGCGIAGAKLEPTEGDRKIDTKERWFPRIPMERLRQQ